MGTGGLCEPIQLARMKPHGRRNATPHSDQRSEKETPAVTACSFVYFLKSATNSDVDYILQFASPSDDCLATADMIMYG